MKSKIIEKLNPKYEVVALIRTNNRPIDSIQGVKGKYFCIMTMFAKAVTEKRTIVFDRETYGCPGASAGLGFGNGYGNKIYGGYEAFAAFFSKGIAVADNKKQYKAIAEKMSPYERKKLIDGERFHSTKEKAYKWITEELPIYDFPEKYRVIKPLSKVTEQEIPESVIFTVNPVELAALITIVGSFTEGINETITPQGGGCQMIGSYVFKESNLDNPKAVLGMLDLAARKNTENLLPNDVLTYSVPWNLFQKMEQEAEDGVFESPIWKDL